MKKKIVSWVMLLAILITSMNLTSALAENLIPNGDFETDEAWSNMAAQEIHVTTEAAYTGTRSLKIEAGSGGASSTNADITVKANTEYRLEYYTKSDSGWNAVVQVLAGSTKLGQNQTASSTNGAEWKKVTLNFDTGENESIKIYIFGNMDNTNTNPVYLDNFTLTELLRDETGTIVNGGFEYGDQLWTNLTNKFSVTTEDKYSGEQALKVTSTAASYSATTRVINVESNTKYILSFYAKKISGDFAMVKLFRGNSDTGTKLTEIRPTSSDWKGYTYSFKTDEETEAFLQIMDGGATTYFDDFTLTKVENETPVIDGGFENGGLGWDFSGPWTISDEVSYAGNYSLKLTGTTSYQYVKQSVNVLPNTEYVVSFYEKSNIGYGAITKIFAADGSTAIVGNSGSGSENRWNIHRINFNSGENDTVTIALMDNGGTVYVDEIKIQRAVEETDVTPIIKGTPADFSQKDGLTVGYIGGSITEGAGASSLDKRWVNKVTEYLGEKTGLPINPVYAGYGGTGSDYGIYRLYDDVLSKSPDIVFVEFAVNDGKREITDVQKNMEGIIRQILSMPKNCSIVLVFTTTEEFSPVSIRRHQEVANYYGVPTINLQDYVKSQIESGRYSDFKPTLSADGVHPNDTGYQLYADYITSVIDSNFGKYICYNELVDEPMVNYSYNTPRLDSVDNAVLGDGWTNSNGTLKAGTTGVSFTYAFKGKSFGFRNTVKSGSVDVSIDGMSYGTINFGETPYHIVTDTLKDTEHIVTVTSNNVNTWDGNPIGISQFFIDDNEEYEIIETVFDKNGEIVNGGFEYKEQLWGNMPSQFALSKAEAKKGMTSLYCDGIGNYNAVRRVVTLKQNSTYVLSYYSKRSDPSDAGNIMIKLFKGDNEDNSNLISQSTIPKGSTEWMQSTIKFDTNEDTQFRILIQDGGNGSKVFFDEFCVTEVCYETITNGSFDNGIAGWTVAGLWSIDDNEGCAKLSGNGTEHYTHYLKQTVKVTPNTDYKVSYKYKSNQSWGAQVKIMTTAESLIVNSGVSAKEDWTNGSLSFNSGENSEIIVGFMDQGGVVLIDDVSIEKLIFEVNSNKFITSNGEEMPVIVGGKNVKAEYCITNSTLSDKPVTAIIAVYKDGVLDQIKFESTIVKKGEIEKVIATEYVSIPESVEKITAKIFLFDSFERMCPYIPCKEI